MVTWPWLPTHIRGQADTSTRPRTLRSRRLADSSPLRGRPCSGRPPPPPGHTPAGGWRVAPARKPAEGFQTRQPDGPKCPDCAGIRPCLLEALCQQPAKCFGPPSPLAGHGGCSPSPPPTGRRGVKVVTWLILPVVICLSQRLSHACLSISKIYSETANGSLNQLSFI
jgi:hypothetical protein